MGKNQIESKAPSYFICVDAVRTIAALAVVVSHYHHFYLADFSARSTIPSSESFPYAAVLKPLYDHGGNAVQLFWVISGFVFMHVYWRRSTTFRQYVGARFARLYPLHFSTLLFVLALQTASMAYVGHWQIYGNNDLRHFLLQLIMASNWSTLSRGLSYNGPIWSVSLELGSYLIFFILLGLMRRFTFVAAALIATICWVISSQPSAFFPLVRLDVFECAGYFFVGVALFAVFERFITNNLKLFIFIILLLMASVGGVLAENNTMVRVSVSCTIIFIAAMLDTRFANSLDRLRPIGTISYSMYLVHVPLQMTILLGADLFFDGDRSFADSPLLLPLYLFGSVYLSVLAYRHLEYPVGRLCRTALIR